MANIFTQNLSKLSSVSEELHSSGFALTFPAGLFVCFTALRHPSLFTLCALCHKGRYWVRVFLFSTRRTLLTKWSNTNDICYSKYADDLTAVISDFATSEFGHIQDWSSANRLHINISKTKEMIIFRPGTRVKIPPQEIVGIKLIAHM